MMTRSHKLIFYYSNVCNAIKSILYNINNLSSLLVFNLENFYPSHFSCETFFPVIANWVGEREILQQSFAIAQ